MIRFSNGHAFEYMTASGALGFDGKGWPWEQPFRWTGLLKPSLFTSVIKTLTPGPIRGNLQWHNPTRCLRPIPHGVVNAVGLGNPGIDWWCKKIGPSVDSKKSLWLAQSLENRTNWQRWQKGLMILTSLD